MPTATVENYVKELYLAEQRRPRPTKGRQSWVQLGVLAEAVAVVPGTATTMVRTLAEAGLVKYAPRIGVRLTAEGRRLALHVLRRHRLVELFLVRIVGYDWSEVHEEAEELEHVISDKLLERIDALLGRPSVDPHGDPIPDAAGKLPVSAGQLLASAAVRLSDQPAGSSMEVVRVEGQEPAFLRFLQTGGLTPGQVAKVIAIDPAAQTLTLATATGRHALGLRAAARVIVRPAAQRRRPRA